jgi:hypothetical protein
MVDKAIVLESKLKEMGRMAKGRCYSVDSPLGEKVRPHFSQPNQFFKPPQMN